MRKVINTALYSPLFLALAPSVFAQKAEVNNPIDACPDDKSFKVLCDLGAGNFGAILGPLITLIFVIAILISLGFLIFGGIRWITSGGDKGGVEGARNIIVAALVGLVIVFLSYFVLNLILQFFFEGVSLSNLPLPDLDL